MGNKARAFGAFAFRLSLLALFAGFGCHACPVRFTEPCVLVQPPLDIVCPLRCHDVLLPVTLAMAPMLLEVFDVAGHELLITGDDQMVFTIAIFCA